jgi:hypothetical protein
MALTSAAPEQRLGLLPVYASTALAVAITEEAERRNLPENAYAPTVKEQKKSFYREDGSQPEFEEIAIFMSDGISVGVINNHVTAVEALESGIGLLMAHRTFQEKSKYLDKVSTHYQQLFTQENSERNPKPIRETYRNGMQEIVELASAKNRTEELVNQALPKEKDGHFLIGSFPDGKSIRINKVNQFDDFKGVKFDDTQLRSLSLEIPQTKIRDAVFLDGELLGVLHKKDEREALENLGLLKFKQTTSVQCNLKSNFTVSFLKIDPQTVKYPEVWTKESQAFNQTQKLTQDTVACQLLKSLTERPTLLFTSSEDKVLGVMGLAVDNHKEQVVRQWLELRGIEFVELSKEEAQLETEKVKKTR